MITFENETLTNLISFMLNKKENSFTLEELKGIKELSLDNVDINGNYMGIDLNVLKYFPNIVDLELINFNIDVLSLNNVTSLSKLTRLTFERCTIDNCERIKSLKLEKLAFIQTKIDNYDFLNTMSTINNFTINGGLDFDLNNLIKLNLISLNLSSSTINNNHLLTDFINIEKIYLDNANIPLLDFLYKFKGLKVVSIDYEQLKNNQFLLRELISQNIKVYIENTILVGESHEI